MKKLLFLISSAFVYIQGNAQINIYESGGWQESAYVIWEPKAGSSSYNVYLSGEGIANQKIDKELIRNYGGYYRADVVGLKSGNYTLKVVPLNATSVEMSQESALTSPVTVKKYVREGFGFNEGIPGAYNADGTLKTNGQVLYITAATANTVQLNVIKNTAGATELKVGLQAILDARGKGYDKTPLAIRFIALVKKENITGLKDNIYINLQGSNNTSRMSENLTLEGVGDDATLHGYGIAFKRTKFVEIRNLGIMLYGDDAITMDTDNTNHWIHNNDFFYGNTGTDADQVKGDGTIDMKYNSTFISISHNHFWDSGKAMGCGGATGELGFPSMTFHHNWFDHTDSRTPRLNKITNAHVYNNYFDGASVYGIGNTEMSSGFIESNYFRNTRRPMMISGQGTDVYDPSTGQTSGGSFSSQDGGMMKAYGNISTGTNVRLVYYSQNNVQFDAYDVTDKSIPVPTSIKSIKGGYVYNNFDTAPTMYQYAPHTADQVVENVTANAGRVNGGDFQWTFPNETEDAGHDLIVPLKTALINYNTYFGPYNAGSLAAANVSNKDVLQLYPNPFTQEISLSTKLNITSIDVLSSTGQLIQRIDNAKGKINLSMLKTGVYLFKINTRDNGSISKFVIKN